MRKSSIKNIITASIAISKMDSDARETLLLQILENNPSVIINAMEKNGVTFGGAVS